jgi:peptidoglycan glycosyltransferase
MNAPLRRLSVVVALLFVTLFCSSTYVQFVAVDSLRNRPGNVRTVYAEAGRERGPIVVAGDAVALSVPVDDPYKFQRTYPGGAVYAPITGYYNPVYGNRGLERSENDLLTGTADQLAFQRLKGLLNGSTPKGAAVELTINPAAQRAAWKGLGDQRGAVVALDPRTGNVLALVSKPSYDPNVLAGHDGTKVDRAARALEADQEDRPLDNRAIAGRGYAPGSVFKLVTSAAALSEGLKPESVVDGPAALKLPGVVKPLPNEFNGPCGPGGKSTLTVALRRSCNTTYAAIGMSLGQEKLRAQAEKFGFGRDLLIPITATASSFPKDLNQPQLAQSSIGQFDVRVTPLQVAMVSAGIANRGVVMQPNLIRAVRSSDLKVVSQPGPQELSQAVSPEVAADLTRMMVDVVENGTGKNARIDGITVAGKTGTAQQGNGKPPHAWFTCFAPAEDPKVAVAVVVEDGGVLGDETSGGRAAAPIAKAVMEAVLNP